MQIPFVYIYIFSLFKTFHRERERERNGTHNRHSLTLFSEPDLTNLNPNNSEFRVGPEKCSEVCVHVRASETTGAPTTTKTVRTSTQSYWSPVWAAPFYTRRRKSSGSRPGSGFGSSSRTLSSGRSSGLSTTPPQVSLSLSLYKWINVYVVVCMCNKCVYVYIFYVCIIGFACKLTWWLTCVFWIFFFGGVVFGWWESGGK